MINVQAIGIGGLGQTDVRGISRTLEGQYATLREKCIEQYGEDFCNSVLPRAMVYAVTRRGEGYTVPWWAWMLAGYLVAKVIK